MTSSTSGGMCFISPANTDIKQQQWTTSSNPSGLIEAASQAFYHHQLPRGGRYRQGRVRAEIKMIEAEIISLENLIESQVLSEIDKINMERKYHSKNVELGHLRKELDRLISGQMRQRKFRERLKRKSQNVNNVTSPSSATNNNFFEAT